MYFLLCTYVHSRYHHRAHLKFEVTLQKCYTKKQVFFCFYLVWFDVGNDQSNDLTKKEKKNISIFTPHPSVISRKSWKHLVCENKEQSDMQGRGYRTERKQKIADNK